MTKAYEESLLNPVFSSSTLPTISPDKGIELAKRLDTVYLETSALAGEGLVEMVETAICKAKAPNYHLEKKTKSKQTNHPRNVFSSKFLQPPVLPLQGEKQTNKQNKQRD